MRSRGSHCWYCSVAGLELTDEHVFSEKNFGGRLIARNRICEDCNREAGKLEREIASRPPLAEYVSRYAPLFNPRQRPTALGRLDDGAEVRAQWTPDGAIIKERIPRRLDDADGREHWEVAADKEAEFKERRRKRGVDVETVGRPVGHRQHMQLVYGLGSRTMIEWPRFGAKVALAVASVVLEESWLETDGAKALQLLFRRGDAPPRDLGISAAMWPRELPPAQDPLRHLAPGEHLLGMRPGDHEPSAVIWMVLFGAIAYEMRLLGASCPPDEPTWLLMPKGEAPVRAPGDVVASRLRARAVS